MKGSTERVLQETFLRTGFGMVVANTLRAATVPTHFIMYVCKTLL